MRKASKRPTDSELVILQALWALGPATVRQVQEHLAARGQDGGYAALLRMMQTMAEKGQLTRDDQERSHVYGTALPREQVQGTLLDDLLERAFSGNALEMLAATLSRRPMAPKERDAAAKLIAQALKDRP